MFESYVTQKLLASMKYGEEDDFMARAPAAYCTPQSSWARIALFRLGDTLIRAGLILKHRYPVERPAISAY